MSILSVKNDNVADSSFVNAQKPVPPTISGYSVSGLDDTALDPAGGQTVLLNGTGFQRGATITLNGNAIAVVTFVSSNQLSFTSPALSAGTYTVYVVNADLGTAIYIPGLIYSNLPTWTTGAGSLGSYYETTSISNTVVATGDAPITYSLYSGSLPTGATLYANGVISGTAPVDTGSTTYSFTIEAIDAQLQGSTRSFSLTINTDVVTWTNPTNGATIILDGSAYSNVLTASDAAGYSIASFTANALPTGLTLSGNTISGTPTVEGNTATLLTATASTTGRSATNAVTWVVSLGDTYWKNVTSLLSTSTPATTPFNTDKSINNSLVTIGGDTRPYNFNPYTPGYYSNYFDGSTGKLTLPSSASMSLTGEFTIECWVYWAGTSPLYQNFIGSNNTFTSNASYFRVWGSGIATLGTKVGIGNPTHDGVSGVYSTTSLLPNIWYHVAATRDSSNIIRVFVNGVLERTGSTDTSTYDFGQGGTCIGDSPWDGAQGWYQGYISNLRVIKGTCLYTTSFTPSTSPLTAVTNTSLLTCQSNRFIDNSTNSAVITVTGTVTIKSLNPYTPNTSYSTYGSTYFDGSGDYLSIPYGVNLLPVTGVAFTAECWIYMVGATNGFNFILGMNSDTVANWLIKNESGTLQGSIGGYTGNFGSAVANTWMHLAVVQNASNTVTGYLNGVQIFSGTATTWATNNIPVTIGARSGTGDRFFAGYIADARIVKGTAVYTSAFTPPASPLIAVTNTQLLTCQGNQSTNNNVFIDNSTNNLAITRAGNTTQGTFSPYGAGFSNYFNGSTDYLLLPSGSIDFLHKCTADWTVEFWLNSGITTAQAILSSDADSVSVGINISVSNTATNNVDVQIYRGSSGNFYRFYTSANVWSVNTWTHFAITFNFSATTFAVYVNGVSQTLTTVGTATFSASGATYQPAIGRYQSGSGSSNYVSGYISNLRLVNGTRVYTTNFTPSTTPLQPIANTAVLTCQSLNFVDNSVNNFTITRNGSLSVQKFSPFAGTTLPTPYYGAYFDGNGDYLAVASNAAFGFGTGDFTIECWIYPTNAGDALRQIYDNRTATADTKINFGVRTNTITYCVGSSILLTSAASSIVSNVWQHVAIVRSSGTTKIYINGTQSGSSYADSYNFTSPAECVIATVGDSRGSGTYSFVGSISNVRVVKGQALYTANFTPSTVPLTTTSQGATASNVSLITCQSNTFVDNSLNNFTVTASGNSQPTTFNPFTVTYSTKQSYTPAVFSGNMYFDGTGDYLSWSGTNISGDFTAEAWVYPTANDASGYCVLYGSSAANNQLFYNASTGAVGLVFNATTVIAATGTAVKLNGWNHIAFVRSGSTCTIYVNGVSTATGTSTATFNLAFLGTYAYTTFGYEVNGYVTDARIINGTALYTSNFVPTNAPLTAVKNTVLLLNGTSAAIYDSSEMGNYETVGDAKINNFGPYNGSYYSVYFEGSSSYLTAPNTGSIFNPGTGNFTFETWAYFLDNTTDCSILGAQTNGAMDIRRSTDGSIRLGRASTAWDTYTGALTLAGSWNHIAIVRNSSTVSIYINGVSQSVTGGTNTNNYTSTTTIGIGMTVYSPNFYMKGYLSNYRFVNGSAVYTTNFTPSTSPLTAITNTKLLTCQSNRFIDNSSNALTLTASGTPKVQTQNPFQANAGECVYFDGTGDYVFSPASRNFDFGSGDWTIELWVYFNSVANSPHIWQFGANASSRCALYIATSKLTVFTSGTGTVISGASTMVARQWYHVAVSFVSSATTSRLFVNGALDGSNTTVNTYPKNAGDIAFMSGYQAYAGAAGDYLNGYTSDLRITKGYARYTTTFTPPVIPYSTK